jgi:hypothetical protein
MSHPDRPGPDATQGLAVVKRWLYQAGIRLATVLNEAFRPD